VGLFKNCSVREDLSACKILWSHVDWCKFCTHLSSLKIPPSPYSKGPLNKTIIQIKLLGMTTIFHCTNLHLPKFNGSWVVAIKQNVQFIFQPPTMFIFFPPSKVIFLKVVHPLKIYQTKNCMLLLLVLQVLLSPQKFERLPFWIGCSYGIRNYGVEVTLNGMISLLSFIKVYKLVQ
jgi:hypothetical protein